MRVKLPLRFTLSIRFYRRPYIVEEHWVSGGNEKVDAFIAELKLKFPAPLFHIRSQFMLQEGRDLVMVFKGGA